MIKRIEWRGAPWSWRRTAVTDACGPVLSRERERELEQPTFLRRGVAIDGLAGRLRRDERAASVPG